MNTDIIIISYNCRQHTVNCIKSIYDTCKEIDFKIIVVDNYSTDDTVQTIKKLFPAVKIISNEKNLGYSAAVNIGVKESNSEFCIISNSDVIYLENSIYVMINYLQKNENVGACGPSQVYPDGKYQISYGDLPGMKCGLKDLLFISTFLHLLNKILFKFPIKINNIKKVGYIDGASIAFRRSAFDSAGGFDEDYFFYTEEADFCYKLQKAGWNTVSLTEPVIIHVRGGTTNKSMMKKDSIKMLIESKALFCRKNLSFFETTIYLRFEKWHYSILKIIWQIISLLNPKYLTKAETIKIFYREWKNNHEKK